MRRNRWIQLGIILFIFVNLFLVFIDDEFKVDRVTYVNSWSNSFTADLKRELYKPVVMSAANEELIYFDKNKGAFQEFLVAEGDEVTEGTALFTYRVESYYETETELVQQIDRVNGEIEAIELAISQIEDYTIPSNEFNPTSSVLITEEDIFVEIPNSQLEAEFMKEQYLIEKETELSAKNFELTALENQLAELQVTGDMLTVESPYAGKIKHIAKDLADPLITIESSELHAIGSLNESERTEVEEGMSAILQVDVTDVLLEGSINSLAHTPQVITIDEESNYSFTASFPEEVAEAEKELLPGYHGILTITLEESLGATTIFEDALIDQNVWLLTTDGKLEQRAVETGLYEDHQLEIINGLEPDSLVAEGPVNQLREGAVFITPLKWKYLNRESLSFVRPEWESFVSGILSR